MVRKSCEKEEREGKVGVEKTFTSGSGGGKTREVRKLKRAEGLDPS